MLTGGHIAASYLITESVSSFGIPLSGNEVLITIAAGNIVDFDLLIGYLNGQTGEAHHQNISHTPIGIFGIWLGINLLFHPASPFSLVLLITMFVHLLLDDIGYWAYKLKLYKLPVNPQINWLYPLTEFHKNQLMKSNRVVLKYYFLKTWPIALIEIILIIISLIVFLELNVF